MKFRNNIRHLIIFHIISPIFILLSFLFYILTPKSATTFYFIAGFLLFDFATNMIILSVTYNEVELRNNSLIITRGLVHRNKQTIRYSNIWSFETSHPSIMPFFSHLEALILLRVRPVTKIGTVKIYKGYIKDSDFENLKKEIEKGIKKWKSKK